MRKEFLYVCMFVSFVVVSCLYCYIISIKIELLKVYLLGVVAVFFLCRIRLSFIIFVLFSLSACGGGGGGNNTPINVTSYSEVTGDTLTYIDNTNATYSTGQTLSITQTEVFTASSVTTIPEIYSYPGGIAGPYILITNTEDGALDGYEYNAQDGREIVDDSLDTFTRIDAITASGSDDPENVNIGDSFNFSENATLFDSASGAAVGNIETTGTFYVDSLINITVPAGQFQALRIDYTIDTTTTENGITDTASMVGSSWFDTNIGLFLKLTGDLTLTLNALGITATGNSERILQSYQVASGSGGLSLANTVTSTPKVTPNIIINSIKRSTKNI